MKGSSDGKRQDAAHKKSPRDRVQKLDGAQAIVHAGKNTSAGIERASPTRRPRDRIDGMSRGSWIHLSIFAAGLALAAVAFTPSAMGSSQNNQHHRKYKPPPAIAHIEVDVIRVEDGKPVDNASIIFHPLEGERDKGAVELKSNDEGKAIIEVLAIGDRVDLQVIANGFQTYGGECVISKPQMTFQVRLNRPEGQYSIYKNHSDTSNNGLGNCGEIVVSPAPSGGTAAAPASGTAPAPATPAPPQ